MLAVQGRDGPKPKCCFTDSTLPTFVNHEQPPTKKQPFSTVQKAIFNHALDVIVPEAAATKLQRALSDGNGTLHYARVQMKLSEIVLGDYFNEYIKIGSILMLSEGRPGIDHLYSLSDGVLRLEVDKATYERMGIAGEAIPSGGRKHVKARFAITLNLRLPSMVRGKKAFDRMAWAFSTVLNHSMTWLFYNIKSPATFTSPIMTHQPVIRKTEPEVDRFQRVIIPHAWEDLNSGDYHEATELLEWLSLTLAASPRVLEDDRVDRFFSRYRVSKDASDGPKHSRTNAQDLTRLRWHGFIPSSFATKILLAVMKAVGDGWFALSVSSFRSETLTILQKDGRILTWEYTD